MFIRLEELVRIMLSYELNEHNQLQSRSLGQLLGSHNVQTILHKLFKELSVSQLELCWLSYHSIITERNTISNTAKSSNNNNNDLTNDGSAERVGNVFSSLLIPLTAAMMRTPYQVPVTDVTDTFHWVSQ